MRGEQISRAYLKKRLPIILQEQLKLHNFPPDHLPSWKFISKNQRFSAQALNNRTKEEFGQNLHEFLRSQGFGNRHEEGEFPTVNQEEREAIEYFLSYAETNYRERSFDPIKSIIRKPLKIQRQNPQIETRSLLYYARAKNSEEKVEKIQELKNILNQMEKELDTRTFGNYICYLEKFFTICSNKCPIDFNPINQLSAEYTQEIKIKRADTLEHEAVQRLWNTVDMIQDCPIEQYALETWRLQMKVLLGLLIAVGPRPYEIPDIHAPSQFEFDGVPKIRYDQRKNVDIIEDSVWVPIMWKPGFFEAYIAYMKNKHPEWNGKLFPSPQSESGSRVPETLNNWLSELCEIANVKMDDGSTITLETFRKVWKCEYKKAIHKNRKELAIVTHEDSKESVLSDEKNYVFNEELLRQIRNHGRKHFEKIINLKSLPQPLREVSTGHTQIVRQTNLDEIDN